jgi:hypothetical protein
MPAIATSPFLTKVEQEIRSLEEIAEREFRGLSEAQLNWKPEGENWTVGQCLDHLLLSGDPYLPKMETAIAAAKQSGLTPRSEFKHSFMGGMIIRLVGPESKAKVPVPPPFEPDAGRISRDVVHRFIEQQKAIQALIKKVAEVDLQKVSVRSPVQKMLKLSLADTLQVLSSHGQRHVQQALRVKRAPGFPPS